MTIVHEVLSSIERIAPARFAFSFDKIGLQVGDPSAAVSKAVVSLDSSMEAAEFAIASGAQLLVSHHPLIWDPLKALTTETREGRIALKLAAHGVAFVACHTNWDCAPGGINDALAAALELRDVHEFGSANPVDQFKVSIFAPKEIIPQLIEAMSEAGAGVIGAYSHCSWRTSGTGTFFGGEGANPAVGQAGRFEQVAEEKLEMVVRAGRLDAVLHEIRRVHRYEAPAVDVVPLRSIKGQPAGRIGLLPVPMSLAEFVRYVDSKLQTKSLLWCGTNQKALTLTSASQRQAGMELGDSTRVVQSIAVVGGAADGEWRAVNGPGTDVFVTGEVKQNVAIEAVEAGLSIVAAGHYATEQPGMVAFAERMRVEQPSIEWMVFEPKPGYSGRPL